MASGQSTFMVEMSEVADILKNATENSFIIFDEIGRGTSTFDGMSIARAVLEYVADKKALGAKTMFATHYHELKEMENTIPSVKNYPFSDKPTSHLFLLSILSSSQRKPGLSVLLQSFHRCDLQLKTSAIYFHFYNCLQFFFWLNIHVKVNAIH